MQPRIWIGVLAIFLASAAQVFAGDTVTLAGTAYVAVSDTVEHARWFWDGRQQRLDITWQQSRYTLVADSQTMLRNGYLQALQHPLVVLNAEPYLPAAFFGIASDAEPTKIVEHELVASTELAPQADVEYLRSLRTLAWDETHFPVPFRVFLDAGHGGTDVGATAHGVREKDITLGVAKAAARMLRGVAGVDVRMSRDDDSYPSLGDRTRLANEWSGDLFVSIHCNSAPRASASGVEVYVLGDLGTDRAAQRLAQYENAPFAEEFEAQGPLATILADLSQQDSTERSLEAAKIVEAELAPRWGGERRGVRQAPFWVLRNVAMPSILVELGFLTNMEEAERLQHSVVQDSYGQILARAILEAGKRIMGVATLPDTARLQKQKGM